MRIGSERSARGEIVLVMMQLEVLIMPLLKCITVSNLTDNSDGK